MVDLELLRWRIPWTLTNEIPKGLRQAEILPADLIVFRN
jgi:hypothetical protein